jgi:hypothetical protein
MSDSDLKLPNPTDGELMERAARERGEAEEKRKKEEEKKKRKVERTHFGTRINWLKLIYSK